MSIRIQAMVRMARSLFLLLFFLSFSWPVASAKNITSSLLSISRWRNCSAALLKPITSWDTQGAEVMRKWGREGAMIALVRMTKKKTFLVTKSLSQMLLTLISRTLERVLVRSSSMTDSSIWLLEIWPKWILERNRQHCQISPVLHTASTCSLCRSTFAVRFALPALEMRQTNERFTFPLAVGCTLYEFLLHHDVHCKICG